MPKIISSPLSLNSAVDRMHAGRGDFKKLMDSAGIYTKIVTFPNEHILLLVPALVDDMAGNIQEFMIKMFGK